MRYYITIFFVALLMIFALPFNIFADDIPKIALTQAEQNYLENLSQISMCVDPDWVPFEQVNENGKYIGISADLVTLMSNRLGIPFKLVRTKDWEETLKFSKNGKCMIIPFLNQTPQREEWLLFSEPIFTDSNVFITRQEHKFIADPADLAHETIVLPSGTSIEEYIRRDYPNLKVLNVASERDAYQMVEDKKADMTLRSLTVAAYTIRNEGLFNLKIAGTVPKFNNQLSIGVLKNEPMLRDILNKAVSTITPEDREQIMNKHVYIKVEDHVNYMLIARILAAVAIVMIVAFYWNYRLRKLNQERHILLDNIQTQVWYMTDDHTYGAVNKAHANFKGFQVADIAFKNMYDIFPKDVVEVSRHSNREVFNTGNPNCSEEWMPNAAAELRLLSIFRSAKYGRHGTVEYIVCSAEDITERKEAQKLFEEMATHDHLTGLPNRKLFMERLEHAVKLAKRNNLILGILFLDLDGFKAINDNFGHDNGDFVLKTIADRLLDSVRNCDTVSRLGGDEFTIIIENIEDISGIHTTCQRIINVVGKTIIMGENEGEITASIGVSIFPFDSEVMDELVKKADDAMYLAKKNGKNRYVFSSNL